MMDPDSLSPEKRSQILRGAAEIFGQEGYEGASMSRIAARACVSKGTLYNHFDSKAALFSAHLEAACTKLLDEAMGGLEADTPLRDGLRRVGQRMVTMVLSPDRRGLYRMAISEAPKFPELARAFYEAGPQRAVNRLREWIEQKVQAGEMVAADPDFAAEQFFALCQTRLWMRYRLHLEETPASAAIDYVVDHAVDTFLARYQAPARP